jgi:hypothetical protein
MSGHIAVHVYPGPEGWGTRADLPDLVEAAAFAPRHDVARKAHPIAAARLTLDDRPRDEGLSARDRCRRALGG